MTIAGVSQVSSRGGQVSNPERQSMMGKDDFLLLLVAQLKAQDPMNPLDGTEFTAQLAQFSALEQLQNINSAIGTLNTSQAVLTNSHAVEYIGKNITAVGDSISMQSGQSPELHFTLSGNAAGLYARIYDEHGNFIRQIEGGNTPAGENRLTWDGRDYLGARAPEGVYTFELTAINELGNSVSATTYASGTVTGVHFKDGMAFLQCGKREIPMGNVVKVVGGEGS